VASLLIRRLLFGIGTLWVTSILVFAGTEILPGDVVEVVLGQAATPESVAAIRKSMSLDQPAHIRYVRWLTGAMQGDFGRSLAGDVAGTAESGRPVSGLIGERLPNSLLLAATTAALAVPLALLTGLLSAMFPGGIFDRFVSIAALCVISVPEFFIGSLLVMLFAVALGWLPAIAYLSDSQTPLETLRAIALPVLTLTAAVFAHMARMTRAALLSVLRSPYVETAILKGATRWRVVFRHALVNATGPIANVVALNLAYLVGGVVIVESVFAYPGMAKLMVDSVSARDIPVVQGCALIYCAVYVCLNLIADVVSIVANPRLRSPA
jgi:peptide/nickel transport system permease protein